MQDYNKKTMYSDHFVSIIIISYNGMSYLENCLDSVMDQDYPRDRYEIIVADNGSTDNSVSFLKSKYKKDIILVEFGMNHGFAKGNNLAVEHAKGDLLVFLNQDTIVHRQWLSGLVSGIVDGGFDACHSNMLLPRNEEFKNVYKKVFPQKIYYYEVNKFGYVEQIIKDYREGIIETRFLSGASFIFKKGVLKKIRYLFDESFESYNEDMELGFRLKRNDCKIGVVPSSVVYHLSSFSFKFNKYNVWKNLLIIKNRFIVFWKLLNHRDFVRSLPYLIVSQPHKVFKRSVEVENSLIKSIILTCSVLPLSLIGLVWFILFLLRISKQTSDF